MLLPISWLRDIVDLRGIDNQTVEEKLFSCGLEVEEKNPFNPDVTGVFIGRVTAMERHPDSDHMFICQVDCGEKGAYQIVTGAQNVHTDDLVPAALDGATVIDRKNAKKVTIHNGKLRGVPSNGMLCSGEELNIDEGWMEGAGVNGILILPADAPVGADIRDYLAFNDEVWDISVTANLPHCQYVYGVARELAAQLDRPLRTPDLSYTVESPAHPGIHVSVEAPDLCPRYIAHYVSDVKIATSPRWMRRRLILCQHNPISNIVDITNYVLTEMGQPMHAFDLSTLEESRIVVRRATDKEPLTTLDGTKLTLSDANLVICDGKKPVGLAGIMGGLNSEIRETTDSVLFEAAKFMRENVRKSSRSLGVSSDSSHRFEKGVDEYTTNLAMSRALHLVQQLGCGKISETHIDICADPDRRNAPVVTTFEKINSVLGIEVPRKTAVDILLRMNYEVKVDGDTISATAPAYREDVESFPDLAEDIIKVYGYEHIVPRMLDGLTVTAGGLNQQQKKLNKCKNALVMQGFYELINYSFYSTRELDLLRLPADAPERRCVRIMNPISENYSIMRTTLVPSMLSILSHNMKKGRAGGRFFELASIFVPGSAPDEKPDECPMLCIGLYGAEESFFTAKGAIESIADEFGLTFTYERAGKCFMHPGATVNVLLDGQTVGWFGQLAYEVAEDNEISQNAYVGEINYRALSAYFPDLVRYKPVSRFASVTRDLALVVEEEKTCGEIRSAILQGCKQLAEAELFDVYRGEQLGTGKKSMAFQLTFVPANKPFTPEEIDGYVNKIVTSLDRRFGVKLR